MKITANSYSDLKQIANLLEDHQHLTKEQTSAFDADDPPTEIVVQENVAEVKHLLVKNLGSTEYPYMTYAINE